MGSYKDLQIYNLTYYLAFIIHRATLKLPQFELYEQESQIRRSSKSTKDCIVEGYGRRKYKTEYIRYLVFAQASCDEATDQAKMIFELYPTITDFTDILPELDKLGKMIANYISFVESSWRT